MSQESRSTTITTTVCMLAMSAGKDGTGAGDTKGLVSDMRPSAPGPGHSSRGRQRTGYGMSHTGPSQQRSSSGGFGYMGVSEMCRDIGIYISVDFFLGRCISYY